jgi:hypothetical protein
MKKLVSIVVEIDPNEKSPLAILEDVKNLLKSRHGINENDIDIHTRTVRKKEARPWK